MDEDIRIPDFERNEIDVESLLQGVPESNVLRRVWGETTTIEEACAVPGFEDELAEYSKDSAFMPRYSSGFLRNIIATGKNLVAFMKARPRLRTGHASLVDSMCHYIDGWAAGKRVIKHVNGTSVTSYKFALSTLDTLHRSLGALFKIYAFPYPSINVIRYVSGRLSVHATNTANRCQITGGTKSKVVFGAKEVSGMILHVLDSPTSWDVAIQLCALLSLSLHTGARPSSLTVTARYPDNFLMWQDVQFRRVRTQLAGIVRTIGIDVQITFTNFKGYNGPQKLMVRYNVRSSTNPASLQLDLGALLFTHAFRQGAFGGTELDAVLEGPAHGAATLQIPMLAKYARRPVLVRVVERGLGLDYMFRPMTDNALRPHMRRAAEGAGLVYAATTNYAIRRGAAELLIKGVGAEAARRFMGHRMTSRTIDEVYRQDYNTSDVAAAMQGGEDLSKYLADTVDAPYLRRIDPRRSFTVKDVLDSDFRARVLSKNLRICIAGVNGLSNEWISTPGLNHLDRAQLPAVIAVFRNELGRTVSRVRGAMRFERLEEAETERDQLRFETIMTRLQTNDEVNAAHLDSVIAATADARAELDRTSSVLIRRMLDREIIDVDAGDEEVTEDTADGDMEEEDWFDDEAGDNLEGYLPETEWFADQRSGVVVVVQDAASTNPDDPDQDTEDDAEISENHSDSGSDGSDLEEAERIPDGLQDRHREALLAMEVRKMEMIRHFALINDSKYRLCSYCVDDAFCPAAEAEKKFNPSQLKRHIEQQHTPLMQFLRWLRSEGLDFVKAGKEKHWACPLAVVDENGEIAAACEAVYQERRALLRHLQVHHQPVIPKNHCEVLKDLITTRERTVKTSAAKEFAQPRSPLPLLRNPLDKHRWRVMTVSEHVHCRVHVANSYKCNLMDKRIPPDLVSNDGVLLCCD